MPNPRIPERDQVPEESSSEEDEEENHHHPPPHQPRAVVKTNHNHNHNHNRTQQHENILTTATTTTATTDTPVVVVVVVDDVEALLPSSLTYKDQGREYDQVVVGRTTTRRAGAPGDPPTSTSVPLGTATAAATPATAAAVVADEVLPSHLQYKDQGRELNQIIMGAGDTGAGAGDTGAGAAAFVAGASPLSQNILGGDEEENRNHHVHPDDDNNNNNNNDMQGGAPTAAGTAAGANDTLAQKRPKHRLWMCVAVTIVVLILAIALPVAFLRENDKDDDSSLFPESNNSNNNNLTTTTSIPTQSPNVDETITTPTSSTPSVPSSMVTGIWKEWGRTQRNQTDQNNDAASSSSSILGTIPGSLFGWDLAMSADGRRIIVGATEGTVNGVNAAGFVEIWQQQAPQSTPTMTSPSSSSSSSWWQLQANIAGTKPNEKFGFRVAMNRLGNIAAYSSLNFYNDVAGADIGLVRVVELESGSQTWMPLGGGGGEGTTSVSEFVGSYPGEGIGVGLALNGDGSILAIGASNMLPETNGNEKGRLLVYQYNRLANQWTRIGQPINGTVFDGVLGYAMKLSSTGTILAAGTYAQATPGFVQVYQYNIRQDEWLPMGQEITSSESPDPYLNYFGYDLGLSADGQILAIGSNPGEGYSGFVQVYQYNSTLDTWVEHGQRLVGEISENFGVAVDLSADGSVLAIGASRNDETFYRAGRVQVYQFDEASFSWLAMGPSLYGLARTNGLGSDLQLSADGTFLAASALRSTNANGFATGAVRFFEYVTT